MSAHHNFYLLNHVVTHALTVPWWLRGLRVACRKPGGIELWCEPELVVENSFPAEPIPKVAAERQADLIVLGVCCTGNFASHAVLTVRS